MENTERILYNLMDSNTKNDLRNNKVKKNNLTVR